MPDTKARYSNLHPPNVPANQRSRRPHAQSQELGIWAHRHAEEGHCRLACMHSVRARWDSLWALGWTASGQAGVRPPTTSRTRMAAAVPRRAAPCLCCVPGLIAARLRKVPRSSLLPPGALCPVRARNGAVAREPALLLAAAVADCTVWPLLLLVVVAAAQDFVEHCKRGGRVSGAAASRPCPGVGRGARTVNPLRLCARARAPLATGCARRRVHCRPARVGGMHTVAVRLILLFRHVAGDSDLMPDLNRRIIQKMVKGGSAA